ncbi:MAG: hypothetical protein R3E58_11830 [Phycisphaerae bacterium]
MKDEHQCGSLMDHPALRKTYELRLVKPPADVEGGDVVHGIR